jgi:hypothetical protein
MPTFTEYASLKDKLIYPKLIDTLLTNNQTMAVWDMQTTKAPYVQVNRMLSRPTVNAVNCSTVITASDISAAPVNFSFDTFEATVPMCWDVEAGANEDGTVTDALLGALLSAVSEKVESLIIDGGTNFNGLDDLIVGAQSFAAGATASTADLSKALRLNKGRGRKVFIAAGDTYDKIESVLKAESTLSYAELAGGTFNTIAYRGVPVLINDNMTAGEVYCATLGGEEGLSVVFNETGKAKIGGVFDYKYMDQTLASINAHHRVLFRATQVLGSPQALSRITSFD